MPGVPGMWLPEHVAAWKLVTEAVHAKKGIIYAQLTHQGRCSIPQMQGLPTVSASATPWSTDEKYPYPPPGESSRVLYRDFPPIELTVAHIQKTIADHVTAAKLSIESGFDGVELHGGNGYLIEQFLNSNVNTRTDEYGGSPQKRCNRWVTWSHLCREIRSDFSKISYVHFVEARNDELVGHEVFEKGWGGRKVDISGFKDILGDIPVISAGLWNAESVWGAVESGRVDGCVFARWFIKKWLAIERIQPSEVLRTNK
ncbi:putative 12-oxophytodienoate reductase 1 [Glarea lozoyensis 74030]|uniref:Putative 12-oxophytodienoate reductase 1 n=1 Tax=Glarea lozoyensis (strain ATCC 74030 / MF5533) TaxID=1104152 RepID=H0EXY9_GLAL7|nr:putative 12-oxophytodienoate reductase 1 [Glarea lozoyensis 74030]